MALRIKNSFCRFTSLLLSWESTFVKSFKHFSTNSNLRPSSDEEVGEDINQREYLRRYALMIGYRGENYYGVCLNPGQNVPSVGREIIAAMVRAGCIDESYLQSAKSMSQASRTDTGVSALKQLVAMDLKEDVDLDKVRPYLSEDIKLYGMIRTTKRFIPFRFCCGRSYLYYIPSYVFSPLDMEMHIDYRLTSEVKGKIQNSLKKFLGRKNYHNFTKGRSFYDPRAKRRISNIELLEPVVKDGMELACIRLQGDSFILNQIRKMVAAVVIVTRGFAPEELIDIALSKQGIKLGRAPPFGLMLEDMDFRWYNSKFVNVGFKPIDFSSFEAEAQVLKDKILSGVVSLEMEYEKTKLWVESLQYISFEPFSKEQQALDSTLEYDDSLKIIRSENATISGKNAAALFI